jgi:hypothetical protein
MLGLDQDLYRRCRKTLLVCGEFAGTAELQAVFIDADLTPYKDKIPEAATLSARVDQVIDYLWGKQTSDGRWVFVQLLRALHSRYAEGDRLREDLAGLAGAVESVLNRMTVVKIPFVVVAMTKAEAEALDTETVFADKEVAPAEKARFREFKTALEAQGIADFPAFYGEKRGEWKPFSCPHHPIDQIVTEIIDALNKSEKVGTIPPILQPEFLSEDFFGAVGPARTRLWNRLERYGCVLVVDAVSIFHPLLRKSLTASEVTSKDMVAVLVFSPVSPNGIQVNQLIETVVGQQMERAFNRFHEEWDRLCEIGVGDLRSLQRWLFSVLPEEADILRQHRRTLNRRVLRDAMGEPANMVNLINGRGLGQ